MARAARLVRNKMRPVTIVCCLFVCAGQGCRNSEPAPDAETARVQERLKKSLERISKKQFSKLRLQRDKADGFTGQATSSDGTDYTITGSQKDGVLNYEAKSTDGKYKGK
jgi:hypothetical protein